jgi:iron uptake system component EfeO
MFAQAKSARFAVLLLAPACAADKAASPDPETSAILAVKDDIDADLIELHAAAQALQSAAPDAAGWAEGERALDDMRDHWRQARLAYERSEGAIAVLFPDLDAATDERYDAVVTIEPDDDAFDDLGFVGVHAVERVLWAGQHPPEVVAFEAALPYYSPAQAPADSAEADRLRSALLQRLVDDTGALRDQFAPLALDSSAAFRGVIGSLAEQSEKVALASTGEDESRYAQHTLADMRANLAGSEATYANFRPWLQAEGGSDLDQEILDGFDALRDVYDGIDGDGVPPVPEGWSPSDPTDAQLDTPYGQLFTAVSAATDPEDPSSLVSAMGTAATLLGIPQLAE